jgi:3D (Asp-Asp-Asp) domain-containing protein
VGAALAEANIALFATDGVEPEMGSWLEPNMVIRVQRSMLLTIEADGRLRQTRSHHTNPLAVIAEAGIGLIGADYTQPGPEAVLQPNDTIRVIRVTEDFRTEDSPIPFQTLWQASPDLALDSQAVISYGENGIQRRRLRIRYENGIEVGQAVDGEWVAREPVDQLIGYGTKITLGVVDTPEGPRDYWRVVRMRVTAYTAASSGKAPGDPGYGITASGRRVRKGIVAIDRSVVPFRSSVFVSGYGVGYAGDTGGGVRGRWIDLGYGEDDYVSWSGYVDVYYLAPVPAPEDINYLLPSVLP